MYKVIAADDEPMVRKALESLIDWESLNCQLEFVASNGKELIEYAEKNQPDIVVTDIKMPEADGIAVAKYFHENYSNTKVILLTAYTDFSYAKQAISYNVVEYVTKTGDFDDVVAAVKKSIQQLEQEQQKQAVIQTSSQVAQHYNNLAQHYTHLITQLSPNSQQLQEQRGGVDLVMETTQYIKQHIDEATSLNMNVLQYNADTMKYFENPPFSFDQESNIVSYLGFEKRKDPETKTTYNHPVIVKVAIKQNNRVPVELQQPLEE